MIFHGNILCKTAKFSRCDAEKNCRFSAKRAEEALDCVAHYLDEAKLLSIKEVSILHGKGNGILRKLIREYLSHDHDIQRFSDASLETGGSGVTKVELK